MKLLLTTVLIACISCAYSQASVKEKIEDLNKQLEKSFQDNDMMSVAAFYLDSALISAGGRMNVTGRKAIDNYWMGLKDKEAKWKLEVESVEDYGLYVLQRGKSFLSYKDGRASNVRFFIIWKKVGESYRIEKDIYTRL